ncbi:SusC/RagA family TonB-linked outer membrane protein [Hymenobacter glacieicola]|uniref:SusC/RagA family TonB-linked outer membrane protein n=1 Tax=Hymenobacter glacieicola TaxID=1562124 RepID=A0ABQ1X1W8_9BACT|nr:SusC/RagA family TonB-linked outer membrane protein [Hymenobacter glacieicola]GGG51861.1 SusC/RagA family TonB-linked outer membrane protein [Hymenobacter glacieicola]
MRKILLSALLMAPALMQQANAQTREISGRVTDRATGQGLPGVTVLVKGTTVGASTNSDGTYAITVPAGSSVLAFSSIGFVNVERTIGQDNVINIGLASDSKQLGEVVVTALGREQQKKALGFSVSEVKTEELVQARSTNVVNSLAGKVAGVRVQASNGMVGSSANIFIRGLTTFTGSNQPLFVVDGIPIDNGGGGNALQAGVSNSNRAIDINQDDIETISVLKGPAAAVLYGSRAASGAILITTKRGARLGSKKQSVTLFSNYNVVKVGRLPDYQNVYGQGNRGAFNVLSQGSWGPRAEGQTITNYRGEQESFTINPDNVENIFKTGSNFQNNVSLSGATERTRYFASYGNLHEVGILDNNDLKRNTVTFNGSANLTEKLRSGVSFVFTNTASERTAQGNTQANPFFRTWFLPRTYDVTKYPFETTNGGQRSPASTAASELTPANSWYSTDDNPLWSIKNNRYNDELNRIVGNVNISYDFTDWLTLDYKLGTDTYSQIIKYVNPRDGRGTFIAGTPTLIGNIQDETFTRRELSSYANLTLKHNFNENFGGRLLLGNEINQRRATDVGIVGSDIQVRGFDNITNTLTYTPFATTSERRLVGVYADLQLDFRNYLFLGLTGRSDWSSTFGPEQRRYFYPGASASFVFTDAIAALKGNSILTSGKIRAAAAKVGREAPEYSTDTYFASTNTPADGFGPTVVYPFRGQLGQSLNNTGGNPNLGPEFTTTYEGGVDLTLLKGRVGLEATYFHQKSEDIIFAVPVAGASGYTNIFQNVGKSESKGFEVLLTSTPVKIGSFTYSNSINWTRIRNRVVELAPGVTQITLGGFVTPSTRLIAGQPYGVLFGSVFERKDGKLLIDASGRPRLAQDNQIIGDPNPDWTGGMTNTFTFKGLSLSAVLDVRYGGDLISRNVSDLRRQGAAKETQDRNRLYIHDGVTADGQPNRVQITAEDYYNDLYGFGRAEFVVFDTSWLRMRELALSYNLSKELLDKTPFGGVELGVNARNVFLYAPNVPHIDPEVNAQGVSNSQGLEFNALPQARTFGGSIKLTF